jgi:hypothetical protein
MTLCLSRALLEQREKLTSRQVSAPVCGDLMQGCDRLCRVAGCGNCEIGEGSKQAANEVWVSLGDMLPDARPLAADVSTAGHAYQSCIRWQSLSPGNRRSAARLRDPLCDGGADIPSGFGRGVTRHVAADKES